MSVGYYYYNDYTLLLCLSILPSLIIFVIVIIHYKLMSIKFQRINKYKEYHMTIGENLRFMYLDVKNKKINIQNIEFYCIFVCILRNK